MIKFKGYDLKSKGIIVEEIPKIQKAKKRIDIYEIYGRNGFLSVDNNTYDSWQLNIQCHLADTANMDDIAAFLDGYGTISFDDVKQSTAIVNNNIEFNEIVNSGFKKFMLGFLVNPIFEDITATTKTITFTLSNAMYKYDWNITPNYRIYPDEIEINIGSDTDFYFNGRKFSLKAGHYFLDCKMKEITDTNGVNQSSKMSGDFPYIDSATEIKCSTNPTTFKVKYRNTYLVG